MANPSDRFLEMRELVRLAPLAASSHNTQPWTFRLPSDAITVLPDFTRRCPIVDPDDAHPFKSLGGAAENLVHAAAAPGYAPEISVDQTAGAVTVHLKRGPTVRAGQLFQAIPVRQGTKTVYEGGDLTVEQWSLLEQVGEAPGVRLILPTSRAQVETLLEYVNSGNRLQLSDPACRIELIAWIRFNVRSALRTGDGLAIRTSGQPSLPDWLAKLIIGSVLTDDGGRLKVTGQGSDDRQREQEQNEGVVERAEHVRPPRHRLSADCRTGAVPLRSPEDDRATHSAQHHAVLFEAPPDVLM